MNRTFSTLGRWFATAIPLILIAPAVGAEDASSPDVYGLVKARFEADTRVGDIRFAVRNARIGVRGELGGGFRYDIQAETNSLGAFSVLDTYVSYRAGGGRWDFSFGQQQYRFGTELSRGAAGNYFAASSFIADFITNNSNFDPATSTSTIRTIGPRDVGALARYNDGEFYWSAGVFNGGGLSGMTWRDEVSLVGRVGIVPNPDGGFGGGVNGYLGHNAFGKRFHMLGAEGAYKSARWIVEGEVAGSKTDTEYRSLMGALHVIHTIPLKEAAPMQFIAPMARWDFGSNVNFNNSHGVHDSFSGHRLTGGLVFGFGKKLLVNELRLNYEHYFLSTSPYDYESNPLLHNRFTVEFFITF